MYGIRDIDYHTQLVVLTSRTSKPDICSQDKVSSAMLKATLPSPIEGKLLTRTDRDDASFRFRQDFRSIKGIALPPPAHAS